LEANRPEIVQRKTEEKKAMSGRYILDAEGNPVPEPDLLTWGKWLETADRQLAKDQLPNGVTVSTVFLGLDHSFFGGPPMLWESMIFGGPEDQYQERYASREEALAGHARAVLLAQMPKPAEMLT
jgi:hypothetical protein